MINNRRFKVDKLIRDKVPNYLRNRSVQTNERVMGQDEYLERLRNKLFEEAKEVIGAKNKEELTEELGDVLEVMLAYAKENNISFEDVDKVRIRKKNEYGGFEGKVYNASVELNSDDDYINYFLSNPDKYPEIK
ncbi:MAG: nucleoside triphosphate pyrophosphohydrolase [Proteobacteria bacterium]|jgi:predicted house-cleaning noncanonical NTP pyrophosphatase (MazG superfamily)|nr:nucleoside triphosphate pyrophosphohydrolase [Pseudomonadota bacterium]